MTFHLARCMGHLQSKGAEFCRNACLPVVSERCRRLRIREKPASVAKGVGASAFGMSVVRADQCRNGVFSAQGHCCGSERGGKEFCIGRLEVFIQKVLAGFGVGADDGDDAAELAVGTEIADALDLLFGEFSHIGIAGSHRFCGRETGSLHIGNGLDRKIFGGKRDRCDGHSDDGLFGGVLEDGHGRALGRLDRLGLRPAGGKVQRKVVGLYFSSQCRGCAKKDTQEASCRKCQKFFLLSSLKV